MKKENLISTVLSFLITFFAVVFFINGILLLSSTGKNQRGYIYSIHKDQFISQTEFDLYNELKEVSFINLFTPKLTLKSWHKYPEVYEYVENRNDIKDGSVEKKRIEYLDKAYENFRNK